MQTIVTEYSGQANRSPEHISGDAESMRIVILEDGLVKILWTGAKFDPVKFKETMKRLKHTPYREQLKGGKWS